MRKDWPVNLGISVLQVSSYRPQADGKSLLCSRGQYSRNKVVPAHPSGEPRSARLERRGCPGQPFMRAGHETLTNRSPNWSGLFLMPLFASGPFRGKRSRNFPVLQNKLRSVSLRPIVPIVNPLWSKYSNVLKPRVSSPRAERLWENVTRQIWTP